MPSAVYLHDGEQQITVTFRTEEDRERFKVHYRTLDALGVQCRAERDALTAQLAERDARVAALKRGLEEWLGWDADEGRPGVPDRDVMVYRTGQLLKSLAAAPSMPTPLAAAERAAMEGTGAEGGGHGTHG